MSQQDIAAALLQAEKDATAVSAAPKVANPDLSVEAAYAIQEKNLLLRTSTDAGPFGKKERVVGHKIGITSRAVQSWLKVDQPDYGFLTDQMCIDTGGEVAASRLISPRVEGEIAFVLGRELKGPGLTAADVLRATDYVLPCIELIDSRVAEWKISYEDTIADNASSARFVLGGTPRSVRGLDLELCGMVLRKNGRGTSTGAGVASLDHPVNAVVWLANRLGELDKTLGEGHIVLSGALGPVVDVAPGDRIEVAVSGMGSARLFVT